MQFLPILFQHIEQSHLPEGICDLSVFLIRIPDLASRNRNFLSNSVIHQQEQRHQHRYVPKGSQS
uniref:Uncharacterized protein n=1 Tax=Octopus bimaculoides TaxID=37653 RepID=A0A0L8HWH2_OCTBM